MAFAWTRRFIALTAVFADVRLPYTLDESSV